ncbi:MAG: DUF3575 domain-containing protein [Bacteroidales bacterium]|nr:DUF3575 domain-containing protein [Bacteroidales bacterium]
MNNRMLYKALYGRVVCTIIVPVLACTVASAQVKPEYLPRQEKTEEGKPFLNRWAFKTNVLEWALTIPNFSLEFDLSASEYNRSTIGLAAKYNWNTWHSHVPIIVFDMLDIRPEYRYYFRTLGNPAKANNSRVPAVKYLGAYVDYGRYSFKWRKGIQGQAVGLGVSYGYALPLYQYDRGALDIDLGFSVGVQVTEYDGYIRDYENNCYAKVAANSSGWHFTPFPVVSELRVALAWRAESVRKRYLGTDPGIRRKRLAESDIRTAFSGILDNFDSSLDAGKEELYSANSELHRADFIEYVAETADRITENVQGYGFGKARYASLKRKIRRQERKSVHEFDRREKTNAKIDNDAE